MSNISTKRYIENRVLQVVLNDSFLKHKKAHLNKTYCLKQGNRHPVHQARKGAQELKNSYRLNTIKSITYNCKDKSIIQKCVDFIMSDSNVSSVVWGSKRVLLQSIGEIILPKLRQKSQSSRFMEYKQIPHHMMLIN